MTGQEKEDRAIDALMVMALRAEGIREPTPEDIEEFINGPELELTPEDEAALDRVGERLPSLIAEWDAKRKRQMVVKDERSEP